MTTQSKYPELEAAMAALRKEKESLQAKSTPLRERRDGLLESIRPTLDEIKRLEREFRSIEQPRLSELDNQIAALARAMGAVSIRHEG